MMHRNGRVEQLLQALELELKRLGLWQQEPPSAQALASTLPFCIDTLEFHQWLQFILIARLRHMLVLAMELPGQSALHAMASEVYKEEMIRMQTLVTLLAQLDEALTGRAVAS